MLLTACHTSASLIISAGSLSAVYGAVTLTACKLSDDFLDDFGSFAMYTEFLVFDSHWDNQESRICQSVKSLQSTTLNWWKHYQ